MQKAPSFSSRENDRFKILADRLAGILATEGITVRTYEPDLPHFSKLKEEQKQSTNHHLEFYCQLCEDHMSEGKSLQDCTTFVWRALKSLDLTPRSDLFNHFDNSSVIEIYSNENVQLFRNLNFFQYCSYTLEELHAKEWFWLFERDTMITAKLFAYAQKIFLGEINSNFVPEIPPHVVQELKSQEKLKMECNIKIAGPLFRNGQPVALIIGESTRLLAK